ncbi:MAG: TldD/PmbA family protein [Candidatus Bipolaricaulota bacterium]
MESLVREAIAGSRADFVEVRWDEIAWSRVAFQRDQLMALEQSKEVGGIVRALVGGAWGVALLTDMAEIPTQVEEATRLARMASQHVKEPTELAEVPVEEERHVAELKEDFRSVPLSRKRTQAEEYNKLIMGYSPEIVSTGVRYTDTFRKSLYANSEGTFIYQELPDVTLLLAAVARRNGDIQQAFEPIGEAAGYELVCGRQEKAEAAAKRAVDLLSAKPVKGGTYTVLLDQQLAGVFIHEAFGHGCEADFLFRNPHMREVMKLGRRFGAEVLNVVDDGYIPGARGNSPFDDEGVRRQKVYLIREGVLSGLMHSRATAHKMGMEPTGNARAISWEHEPIVRMRNTYIEPGEATFEEMIKDVDNGIYAKAAFGGQTMFEQFTFSAGYAYEIKGGEVGPMLRDVVLTGNVFHILKNIDMVGRDFQLLGGSGGCGKGGQGPLPVTDGAPHVRVHEVTIGGR